MQKSLLPLLIIAALVIGGSAFYGGMTYARSKGTSTERTQARSGAMRLGQNGGFTGTGAGMGGMRGGMGNFVAGEVVSKDTNSITVKLRDGGSKIVFLSASTTVNKMTMGSVDDLKTGTEVTMNGTNNQDGSVTASMIQIRPEGQGNFFMREAPPRAQ